MELKTELYPWQRAAVDKLIAIRVGALYMEMGTGKTRTALELFKRRLDAGKVDVCLWLCPCSVKKNLRDDLLFHCGAVPEQIIIRGIESLSSSSRLYAMLLRLVQTHRVFLVVDESNLVKNHSAIRTARITALSKLCPYRYILNGTPISRNEADLFAQWYVLDWRILGYQSYYSFAANHLEYWTIRLPDGREIEDRTRVRRVLHTDYLAEKIEPYTVQVKKDECIKLPDKHYEDRLFRMTSDQELIYEETKGMFLDNVDEFRNETIYRLFTALQHVASGRRVVSKPSERMETAPIFERTEDNPRIVALFEALARLGEEKVIVFCKYQSEIDDLGKLMAARGISCVTFTGRLPQGKRQDNLQRFRGDAQVLLANKACGAYGLNLQFSHNIIFYSNDFDLATRLQAEDRVHRLGQEQDVRIIDIYTSGIDDFIITCLRRKEHLLTCFKREIQELKKGGGTV